VASGACDQNVINVIASDSNVARTAMSVSAITQLFLVT